MSFFALMRGSIVNAPERRKPMDEHITQHPGASFQRAFMDISGLHPMKALYTQ
jgi:hypothetical protein